MNNGSVKGFRRRRYEIILGNKRLEPLQSFVGKKTAVDRLNEKAKAEAFKKKLKLISEGVKNPKVRVKELHPTKGYRNYAA